MVALVKSGNVKRHYETKHAHFEQKYPLNSEVRGRKINHLQSYHATCSLIVRSATQQERAYLKYRSTLTNEHLHQCLRLAFTYFMPKFKPQKSVNFHTNKARPHHLSCIVRTFMLCFWILTVTVPDPGLNGNWRVDLLGFLIEYPWCTVFFCVQTQNGQPEDHEE